MQKRSPRRDDVERIPFLHISFCLPRQLHNRRPLLIRSARQTALEGQQPSGIRNSHPKSTKNTVKNDSPVADNRMESGIWIGFETLDHR